MPTTPPIPLSTDVRAYVYATFDEVNDRVTARLDRMPTVHEEALDLAFVDAVATAQGPHLSPCGTVVDIDVHFVGGGRHWARWEIADIGFIVTFRRANTLLRTKVVLLQSKRLYPRESEFTESEGLARRGGFGSLMSPSLPAAIGERLFRFDETCRYKALQVGDEQWRAILDYQTSYGLPVHYMLYHPSEIPSESSIPVAIPAKQLARPVRIGARILAASSVRTLTGQHPRNYAPSYSDLADELGQVGVQLPEFVIDHVLSCREGYVVDDAEDNEGLRRVFNDRNAPIAAAIRIDINVPD